MSLVAGTLRGAWQRAGVSLGILLVATVASAAAAAGPTYDAAARTSILQDNLHDQPPIERTVEANDTGAVAGLADNLSAQVTSTLAAQLGGLAAVNRLFQPPVQVILAQVSTGSHLTPLTWRTDECTHLRLTAGFCPRDAGQVLVSTSYARLSQVRPGDTIATSSGYGRLIVTGEYAAPSGPQLNTAYWLVGPCDDFLYENPGCLQNPSPWDAMFTSPATFAGAPASEQGNATVLDVLAPGGVRPEDLPGLEAAVNDVLVNPTLEDMGAVATSSIPQLIDQIRAGWQTLDVPVFLITCQLLLLIWLLLFLLVTETAEARAGEVALAKLRGHGRLRTVAFGLSEPVLLLAVGLPAGLLVGWAAAGGLARVLLRPGTPVGLPVLAVAAAAAATLGGLVAIVLAARRALVRPVTEQWRRTARAVHRGWVLDAVLLTAALAGLAELVIGGNVTSARSGSLGLLVPGLLGLAAAVAASRLLPVGCGLASSVTRQRGGTGLFLAVRHIARRPGGTRTTIVLTAAFALATFAIAAFSVDQRNVDRVAAAQTGAAAVLTVTAPAGQDLGTIVDRIDPGGGQAAAVDRYAGDTDNGSVLLAVQPARFARVALWPSGSLDRPPAFLGAALAPRVALPLTLPAGSTAVRVRVGGASGITPGSALTLWVVETGTPDSGQTPVSLGVLRPGWLSAALSGCPCQVSMLSIDTPTVTPGPTQGSVTLSGLAARVGGAWAGMPAALASPAGWAAGAEDPEGCASTAGQVRVGSGGLNWSFRSSGACSPAFRRADTPTVLPALVSRQLTSSLSPFSTLGLDGMQLTVRPVALADSVPGAPAVGIVVDRTYAQREAYSTNDGLVAEQVWVAPGALGAVRAGLAAAGVRIDGVATTAAAEAVLMRQGPALASVLFLAVAAAAALLAAGAAVLGLYQAGRRRSYEYAALVAGRVPRRSLRTSVFIEQAVVLGFGVVTGVAAGIGSAVLVLRTLPVFLTPPAAPSLLYVPSATQVLVPLVITVALLAAAVTVATVTLIRSARPELLREAPP